MLPRMLFAATLFSVAAPAATVIHYFNFQNSLGDLLGGPSLVSYGGTLGPSSYSFAPNQGLSLEGAFIDTASYSIQIRFAFSTPVGFRKVLDFSNLQEVAGLDPGLYTYNQNLYYWAAAQSGPVLTAGQLIDVVLTRDSGGNVTAYANGNPVLSFVDNGTTSRAQLTAPDIPLWFFVDDYHSLQAEASGGEVYMIRIWDGPLAPEEVSLVSIPEPAAAMLLLSGLAVIAARRRTASRG